MIDVQVVVAKNAPHCFTENRIYILNHDLDKIDVLSKKDLRTLHQIRPRDFDFNHILNALKGEDSIAFLKWGFKFNTKGRGFRPGYKWFDISDNGECYAMLEYVHPHPKEDDTLFYDIRSCIVKMDTLWNVRQVYFIDSVKTFDIYTSRFILRGENRFITSTHDPYNWFDQILEKNPEAQIKFVTEYVFDQQKNIAKPVKWYAVDLPLVYKKKYHDNYTSPELCSFPYFALWYANELYNLETLNSYPIVDSETYFRHVDLKDKEIGKEKYNVMALCKLNDTKELLVVYRLGSNVFVKVFDESMGARLITINSILSDQEVDDCFIDPYSRQIYFTFENDVNTISIPLWVYGL